MRTKIAAAVLATTAVLGITATSAASAGTAPSWLHVTHTTVKHHGHPCVIVGGGNQDTTALVCSDGYAEAS